MSPRTVALVAAALVAGCSGKPSGKKGLTVRQPDAAPAAAAVEARDSGPLAESGDFVYSGAGKRDPFRSYLAELARDTSAFVSRCQGPLGRFEVEQMKLVAVIVGLEDPVAMVEVPAGEGVVLRRGQCIGKNGGVVAAVRSGEVIVTEYRVRADGSRDAIQTSLQLPKQQLPYAEE